MERFQAKEWQCRVALLVFGGVYSVHHPLKELSKPLQSAHRAGLVAGDINVSISAWKLGSNGVYTKIVKLHFGKRHHWYARRFSAE
jgi:hypothetical protein